MGSRKRRRSKLQAHVRFYSWMMGSAAYQSLCVGARALLIELYSFHNGVNNGFIFLSVREAARRLNVAANTATKFFQQLENRGFIRARQRGAFTLKARHATQWILTEHEYANQPGSKDFMRWPFVENQKPVAEIATDSLKRCDRGQVERREIALTDANSHTVATFPAGRRSQILRHSKFAIGGRKES